MVGIVSYGSYIPKYRLSLDEVASAWDKQPSDVRSALGVIEKSVPYVDEDAVTIALESAYLAMSDYQGDKQDIGALFTGSESHPYAVNPTSTIVGELLGLGNNYLASDLQFACKAGTTAIQAIAGLIMSNHIKCGLAIGSDAAQSKTHDALEYTSAAAGVSLILGSQEVIAELISFTSYASDTPDFWRRDGIRYPSHAGRFTGEPAYFAHVMAAANQLLNLSHMTPGDFDYAIFHMPNGKFPKDVGKRLGFTIDQLAPSLIVERIGNPYSASSMLGLAAVLDIAKPNSKIFMVSYGSGAGSDAFIWKTTDKIIEIQNNRRKSKKTVLNMIEDKINISYTNYLKYTHKI